MALLASLRSFFTASSTGPQSRFFPAAACLKPASARCNSSQESIRRSCVSASRSFSSAPA